MSYIKTRIDGNIAFINIERAEVLNALNKNVVNEIEAAVSVISKEKEIRAIVIYSKDNFAAGADIKDMVDCNEKTIRQLSYANSFDRIAQLKIPTIAAIEGYALGGGLELALACDLRIASYDSKLGFPEITLGIIPGAGGTIRTPRIISPAIAKELIYMGRIINAERAEKIGLVNIAVPKEDVMITAQKWAMKLASQAPLALEMAKEIIDKGLTCESIQEGLELEADGFAKLFKTNDQKEGMTAFIEKRKPNYSGC